MDRIVETAIRERARVVVLNSPNNPTGSALPEGAVERILAETGALVVCDEAYQDFGGPTAIPLLPHLAGGGAAHVLQGDGHGRAAVRAGAGTPRGGGGAGQGQLPYNVNLITLAAAEVALDNAELLGARTRAIAETRDRFLPRLAAIGDRRFPAANFVLIRCRARPAGRCSAGCTRHGILVRDVSGSVELAECLRISIGTEEDMDAVLDGLSRILGREAR